MHFCVSDVLRFLLSDIGRAGRVSIGIYKGLNFQTFTPKCSLSFYPVTVIVAETSEDGKA
jgi:hypothetical protein